MTVRQWFRRKDPGLLLLSADEWAAREHQDLHVPGAVLVVLHDGGRFSRYSGTQWPAFRRKWGKEYREEEINGWATALYRREP